MRGNIFISAFVLSMGFAAVAACVRDGDNISNPVEVTITADYPAVPRTDSPDGVDIPWRAESRIGVFACSRTNHRWDFGNNTCFALTDADGSYGTFRGNVYLASFIGEDEVHEITYHAYYPYGKYNCTDGAFAAEIPNVQYPAAGSIDPQADFLMGSAVEACAPPGLMDTDGGFAPVHFTFTRPLALISLVFSDITIENQKIEKIVFSIEGASLAGPAAVDLRAGTFTTDANEFSDSITLVYPDGGVAGDGFEAWFTMFPVAARNFSLLIETEDYLIAAEAGAGEETVFAAGRLTRIPVSLASATVAAKQKPVQGAVFHEVKAHADDFSGKYIIACNDRAMGTELLAEGYNIRGVDISAMKNAADGSYVFPGGEPEFTYTIAKLDGIVPFDDYTFGYTIHNAALGYIGTSANLSNNIEAYPDSGGDNAKWDLRYNTGDGMIDITNYKKFLTGNFSLRWDDSSEVFAAYAGTQSKVCLFRLSESTQEPGGEEPGGESVRLDAPALNYTVTADSFRIFWEPDERADGYRVSVDGSEWSAVFAEPVYERSGLASGVSFAVRVKAVGSGIHADSDCSEITVTTSAKSEAESGFPAEWNTAALATRSDGIYHATSGNTSAWLSTENVNGLVAVSGGRLNAIDWSSQGASWVFAIPVKNMSSGRIKATFTCRSGGTGPKTFRMLYGEDGDGFVDSGETVTATDGDTANGFGFTPEIKGNPAVFYIKLQSAGDASGGGLISSAGTNRISAITITKE